jgi:D-glucosaminate-6-phosphate ammonia-lyase
MQGARGMNVTQAKATIFEKLGVKPAINACGIYTDLGGSRLSPTVWAAMEEVNSHFVNMMDLLDKSGEILATMVGAESARVTPGASAAIALGTAACITGMNGVAWERLPDVSGMKGEVIIQRVHRYKYDRCAKMAGATLIEVGDETGTTPGQLSEALGPKTAAILFPAHLDGIRGSLPLRSVIQLGHEYKIPTLVDAAYLIDPPQVARTFSAMDADLVCFSSKYFGGPNAGGFICGRKDLMQAIAGLDFTRFESGKYRSFGRAFKLDRQMIVAVVVAFQEWMAMDHHLRWEGYAEKVRLIIDQLGSIPGVTLTPQYFTMDERLVAKPVNCLVLAFGPPARKDARAISQSLIQGEPSIVPTLVEDKLVIVMDVIGNGEEQIVADRLKHLLKP